MNGFGQLGDGTTVDKMVATQIPMFESRLISMFSAGPYHSMMMATDGVVMGTGGNGFGQLGDEGTVDRHAPYKIATVGVARARSVSAGQLHSLLLQVDGSLWGFGSRDDGQLGAGPWNVGRLDQMENLMNDLLEAMDADSSGDVSEAEMLDVMVNSSLANATLLSMQISLVEVADLFGALDADAGGTINRKEVKEGFTKLKAKAVEKVMIGTGYGSPRNYTWRDFQATIFMNITSRAAQTRGLCLRAVLLAGALTLV